MNAPDNTTWGSNGKTSRPGCAGESVILDFNVTAPAIAGTYNFQPRCI